MIPTLILDKDILDDLYIRESEFTTFIDFLKKNFRNYNLIINHTNQDDLEVHCDENPLIEIILDKIENIIYISDLKETLKNKKINKLCSKRTIIICDLDDIDCNNLLEETGLLHFNLNTLKTCDFFDKILITRSFKVTKNTSIPNENRFKSWNDITQYIKYCNSLIIFDKYIYTDKSNQKLKNNLFKFIESLTLINKKDIDLTIISEFNNDDIVKYYDITYAFFKSKGINNITLNLIHHSKAFYPRDFEGLHSRFILTNYLHIFSSDSFNYFKDNGKFNNLADIDIKLNMSTQNRYSYETDLESIKTYASKLSNDPSAKNLCYKNLYYKNKYCTLF